jgi:hypothetical protein
LPRPWTAHALVEMSCLLGAEPAAC